jgi:CheY-like chemotaxis protein
VLVLLDVSMPGLDGIEVCRSIKADPTLRGTTVVMLTAMAQADTERHAATAGADAFLTKPFSPGEVLDLARKVTSAP